MWKEDNTSKRRHKLITKELAKKIPPLGSTSEMSTDEIVAPVKLFSPYTGWRYYITEWDSDTGECFGLVEGYVTELGPFDLTEIAEAKVLGEVPAFERDLYWNPMTISEIKRQS